MVSSGNSGFLQQLNWPPQYDWKNCWKWRKIPIKQTQWIIFSWNQPRQNSFLGAFQDIVPNVYVGFHWNPINDFGDKNIIYMYVDRKTDRQGDSYRIPNFVSGGYTVNSEISACIYYCQCSNGNDNRSLISAVFRKVYHNITWLFRNAISILLHYSKIRNTLQ